MTTSQYAQKLRISPRKLRKVLRTLPRYQDGVYTRYLLSPFTQKIVAKKLAA